VAGLMDVIDEDEELNYLDDDTPAMGSQEKDFALKTTEIIIEPVADKGESSGLKAHNPSRSPPPVLKDDGGLMMNISEENIALAATDALALQLEKTGSPFDSLLTFSIRLANFDDYELTLRWLVLFFSGFHFSHHEQ
jgi:hypothetical protein